MQPDRLNAIDGAARAIVLAQFEFLVRRYGTDNRFRDGWGNHNATHNLRVAWHAARGAARLVETGAAPPESVAYALIAGIHHDHVQEAGGAYDLSPYRAALSELDEQQAVLRYRQERAGVPTRRLGYDLTPDREELSVLAAHEAMRNYEAQHGYRPAELFTQAGYDTVGELIMDTQVFTVTPQDGIESSATIDRPLGAAVSDADKSDLALQGGLRRGMLLLLERNRDSLAVPAFSDGSDLTLPREVTVPYLEAQAQIYANHRYTLGQSESLFPQRAFNLEQLRMLAREHAADRMTWTEVLAHTTDLARAEPIPSRGASSRLVSDPHTVVPELVSGLKGAAPGVRRLESPPVHLATARDLAGIDLRGAVLLSAPPGSAGERPVARASAGPRRGVGRG